MNSLLYINYPSWIHPEIFPDVPFLQLFRWYGLMYVFAFGFAYMILRRELKEGVLDANGKKATEDDIVGFIATGIVFLLLGARIFATLVYDTTGKYLKAPWLIFWPFDENMNFTGLAGMSYHGGFIGGLIGMIVWTRKNKRNTMQWIDAMCVAIPCGYTFGRLGNFLNGELFGRITTMPWGMVFPDAQRFSIVKPWVTDFANACGMEIPASGLVNLPRHPSQLYEAFFEGIFLFVILWLVHKKKPFHGFISALYTAGYGLVRFVIEYFRMPDADLGYRLGPDKGTQGEIWRNTSLLNLSTGQLLCLGMIAGGIALGLICWKLSKNKK